MLRRLLRLFGRELVWKVTVTPAPYPGTVGDLELFVDESHTAVIVTDHFHRMNPDLQVDTRVIVRRAA